MGNITDRDARIEALLRQALRGSSDAGATADCLDAETMAAWTGGDLTRDAFAMAEAHLADCPRCQALAAALARTEPTSRPSAPARASTRWLGWFVPLAAAAALVVAIWIIPRDASPTAVPPAAPLSRIAESKVATDSPVPTPRQETVGRVDEQRQAAKKDESQAPRTDAARADLKVRDARAEAGRTAELDRLRQTTEVVTAPAAAQPTTPAAASQLAAKREAVAERVVVAVEILSPDPRIRWRILGAAVERSTDAGATWTSVSTGVEAELTAGVAPAPAVCWLVGRRGVVLLSTDGRTFRRVPFPESTDLVSVRAIDTRTVIVTTADGREVEVRGSEVFSTGGDRGRG
jgi:hypothetical protein